VRLVRTARVDFVVFVFVITVDDPLIVAFDLVETLVVFLTTVVVVADVADVELVPSPPVPSETRFERVTRGVELVKAMVSDFVIGWVDVDC
jgi:hypothetical protein